MNIELLKIEKAEQKVNKSMLILIENRKRLKFLKKNLNKNLFKQASKISKFKIGDIIRYSDCKKPILVTKIECYENGKPTYKGLEIANNKITRNIRSSFGWGTESPYIGGDGNRYPKKDWIKIGNCEDFVILETNNPKEIE